MSPETRALLPIYATGTIASLAASGAAFAFGRRYADARPAALLRIASAVLPVSALLYLCEMLILGHQKAAALNQYADRATHLEILWRSTHGLGLTSLMSTDFFTSSSWFAAHFTPILYLVYWPFFKLFPGQMCLTVVQTVWLLSAAIPIFLFARDRLSGATAYWIASAFLFYPTLHYINLYGTAYLDLSIPLLAWAMLAYERGRLLFYWIFVALCLLVREEMGLVIMGLGVYSALAGRRRLGIATFLVGAAYIFACIKVIIPSFRADTSLVYLSNYRSWGDTPGEILWTLLRHPFLSASRLLTPPRLGNAAMYLLPLSFLPLLAPLRLLVAAPNAATTFLSDSISNYNFTLYYLSPTIPVIFFSAIDGLSRIRSHFRREADVVGAAFAIFIASLSSQIFFGPSPISIQYWFQSWKVGIFYTTNFHRSQYVVGDMERAAKRVAAKVPLEAEVSAEQHLLPLLFNRKRMLVFPNMDDKIDHVLINRSKAEKTGWGETYLTFRKDPERYYATIEQNPRWSLIAEDGGARLYRRQKRH